MSILSNLWSFGGYVVPLLFVLGLIIFIHEMGHFLVGRWCGVKADVFSMGFGPELWHRIDKHGTRWRLAAIPLGGYVKFHGDANPASAGVDAAQMSEEEKKVSFFTQPVWKRAAIVFAGPLANFLLAIVIFAVLSGTVGRYLTAPRVAALVEGGAAEKAGFQPGDLIISIDGQPIRSWVEMQRVVQAAYDRELNFGVERGGKDVTLKALPAVREMKTMFGKARVNMIGLYGSSKPEDQVRLVLGPVDSVVDGIKETWFIVERTGSYLGRLFVGKESTDQISGLIGTGYVAGQVAKISFSALINLAAVMSVSIGLLNLLPVPILDGGHLVFYTIEALKGKPLSEKAQDYAFRLGFTIVIALMLLATFNDVMNLAGG